MSIPNAPVSVGDVLAGKYRTERLLGMGAMGVVVEALHLGLNQRVALKFLLAQRGTHQALHERFLREARACVALKSQHVTRVTDVGTLESGAPYLVMELLDGSDLDNMLQKRGRVPIAEAVEYVLQACEAVGEAHRAGIIHRDLKPANLFLTTNADGSPCVKVLDFGVSKFVGADLKLTAEGQAVGSPLYMSPEQLQGKPDVDARSDLWSMGIILYELVAGTTPFNSETMTGLTTNILVKPPVPLTKYVDDAPPGFEAILLQCLDKDPGRRWPNLAAFAAALVPYAPPRAVPYATRIAAILGVTVEPSRPTDVLTLERARMRASEPAAEIPPVRTAVATTGGATSQAAGSRPNAHTGRVAAGVAAALVALALGGASIVRRRTDSTAANASAGAPGSVSAAPSVTAVVAPPLEAPQPPGTVPTVTAAPGASATVTASATVAPTATPPPKGIAPARGVVVKVPPPTLHPVSGSYDAR